jgi:hypothetical protein
MLRTGLPADQAAPYWVLTLEGRVTAGRWSKLCRSLNSYHVSASSHHIYHPQPNQQPAKVVIMASKAVAKAVGGVMDISTVRSWTLQTPAAHNSRHTYCLSSTKAEFPKGPPRTRTFADLHILFNRNKPSNRRASGNASAASPPCAPTAPTACP